MLIVRQCWLLFFYSGIGLPFAGVYSIKYEDDSNRTTVQSRQLQSGFFPSEFNQNNNYNDNSGNYNDNNYDGNNLNYNGNSGNYNGNYNSNTNYDFNPNGQYQAGNTLQFPSNDNPPTNSPPLNVQAQDNSVFNTGEYYNVDQQQPQQFNNNDVQYFAYQDPQLSTFANNKQPVTSYYQPSHTFQPNLQNAPPPQRVTQRPIGPFQRPQRPQPQRPQPQRPQRPLGPVNNIPQPAGYYQQNYAGNFNNYQQTTSNPISNFISNIGQGAADFFNGGPNSNYFSGPNGPPPPQQFDSFNRPIRPNGGRPPPPNGGRPPLPPQSPFGTIEQLGKAIDEITRNDDFQCIPKVICQMFGNQRQQSSYSSILGSPIFSGLIAAVPSSSTGLVYGRAALLGYTSGEHTCNGAYPKCPKNEDDLLYYLNNHRGGFFRFFNGGASFGDDTNYNYNQHNNQQNHYPNNQYNQNYNQQQTAPQQSSISNLAALQNLADTINQSDGINLSNLASNGGLLSNLAGLVGGGTGGGNGAADLLSLIGSGAASGGGGNGAADLLSLIGGGAASGGGASGILNSLISGGNGVASSSQASDANSVGPISLLSGLGGLAQNGGSAANIGSVVGNLLTGFIGNRFSSRKISKRSVAEGIANEEGKSIGKIDDEAEAENATISGGSGNQTDELSDIEPRIVHGKVPILSSLNEPTNSNIKFVDENENENVYRDRKQIKFNENHDDDDPSDNNSKKSFFKFPSNDIGKQNENVIFPPSSSSNDPFRTSKKIKFQQQTDSDPHFFPAISDDGDHHQSLNEIDDTSHRRIKMVFPDRTGTGNLIFDNKEFDTDSTRIGRILTGLRVLQQLEQIQQLSGNTNRIPFDATNKYNGNRYESNSNIYANPLYSLAQSNGGYQQSSSPNRYTTNQQAINHRFGNQNYNINYNSQSSYGGGGGTTTYSGNDDTSQNVYVTNGQGVVEYYINKAGVKVYV